MKHSILLFLLFTFISLNGQSVFPDFLQGTWKTENKDIYEHWDLMNDHTLKGFSYNIKNGVMNPSEYLEIHQKENGIFYTASVLRQNQGKGIDFKLTRSDSLFTFENPNHDFPKIIIYRLKSASEILVEVSDGNKKGFSYIMKKHPEEKQVIENTGSNPNFDPQLAEKLGGDDYGMKGYILVILKTGPNTTTDKNFIGECFRGHMNNINTLVESGKLIVAGPLQKNEQSYRGIFILNAATLEEANELLKSDPAVREGLLDAELYKWYGSAALSEYLPFSDKIWKNKP
ncbi:MAG: hypothetical protein IPM42_06810 [Saprospiraceae bacterium]|nr:hypothetical protein [Saprospiraceae bacterium]